MSKNNPFSLFDSQGDRESSERFVALTRRITESGTMTPKEKADILLGTLEIIDKCCGIEHLGVRSIEQEFDLRFRKESRRHPAPEIIMGASCYMNQRILPLYAPWDSTQNSLIWWYEKSEPGASVKVGEYTNILLYAQDTYIVGFEVRSKVEGNIIQSPHLVIIELMEAKLQDYMEKWPILLH